MNTRPCLTVGMTGHRPNRLRRCDKAISRQICNVLSAIRSGSGAARRCAISALAEGSDRLFAEAALRLDFDLHALLPFERQAYETTFEDCSTTPTYRKLLAQAVEITELPGRLETSDAAYVEVGRATVERSSILLAVWDGEEAAGQGGTTDVISYAVSQRKPVIWISAARPDRPRLIPTNVCPDQIVKHAYRSRRLSHRQIRAVARRTFTALLSPTDAA